MSKRSLPFSYLESDCKVLNYSATDLSWSIIMIDHHDWWSIIRMSSYPCRLPFRGKGAPNVTARLILSETPLGPPVRCVVRHAIRPGRLSVVRYVTRPIDQPHIICWNCSIVLSHISIVVPQPIVPQIGWDWLKKWLILGHNNKNVRHIADFHQFWLIFSHFWLISTQFWPIFR